MLACFPEWGVENLQRSRGYIHLFLKLGEGFLHPHPPQIVKASLCHVINISNVLRSAGSKCAASATCLNCAHAPYCSQRDFLSKVNCSQNYWSTVPYFAVWIFWEHHLGRAELLKVHLEPCKAPCSLQATLCRLLPHTIFKINQNLRFRCRDKLVTWKLKWKHPVSLLP